MSLEHLKSSELPYYLYYCGDNNDVLLEAKNGEGSEDTGLLRHLHSEHTIIDDRVIRAMRNKADCVKRFYLRNAWTFGVVLEDDRIHRRNNRVNIFGTRNIEKTYLQQKELEKLKNTLWNGKYLNKLAEISNVDKKKYEQSVRNLIKAVS